MKKAMIWVALGLMTLGIVLFVGLGISVDFDFSRCSNVNYVTNTYDFLEDFHSIDMETITADIDFRLAEDGVCRIVCYERENMRHDVAVKEGVLTISVKDTRSWMEHISIFNWKTPCITVYLPAGEYQSIQIDNTTGDVKMLGAWNIEDLKVKTTTGDIKLGEVVCKNTVSTRVSTGDILLEGLTCGSLEARGTTGDVTLQDVISSGSMKIQHTTGDITLNRCDAGELTLEATTGDIEAILLSEKTVTAKTTTGDVDVPKGTSGGRCDVTTTTGDICIRIP